jgi:hypothetical protein
MWGASPKIMPSIKYNAMALLVGPSPSHSDHVGKMRYLRMVQDCSISMANSPIELRGIGDRGARAKYSVMAPTITVNTSYYSSNGVNERNLGFYVQDAQTLSGLGVADFFNDEGQISFSSSLAAHGPPTASEWHRNQELLNRLCDNRNIFLLLNEARDDMLFSNPPADPPIVFGVGNCYIKSFNMSASVSQVTKTTVSFDGANADIRTYTPIVVNTSNEVTAGTIVPAINPYNGTRSEYFYDLSTGTLINPFYPEKVLFYLSDGSYATGGSYPLADITPDHCIEPELTFNGYVGVIRPDKIEVSILGTGFGALVSGISTNENVAFQSFDLNLDIPRKDLVGFGSIYPKDRKFVPPAKGTFSVEMLLTGLNPGDLSELDPQSEFDIHLTLCGWSQLNQNYDEPYMRIKINGAFLDSQSFSSAIGQNASWSATFSFDDGLCHEMFTGSSIGHFPTSRRGMFVSGIGYMHGNSVISYGSNEAFSMLQIESGWFDAQRVFDTYITMT